MLRSPGRCVCRGRPGVWLSAVVALVAMLVSSVFVTAAGSASRAAGLIAFSSERGVYVMQSDGTGVQSLWRGTRLVLDVAWSPDGRRLAVSTSSTANDAKSGGIWVMNADGSGALRVSNVPAPSVTWSPDGRRIAFTGKRYGNSISGDIWVMKPDGSNVRVLKRTPRLSEGNVDWKPTGGWVAFDGPGGYVRQVYLMRTNGRSLRPLTSWRAWGLWSWEPDWSPDGRRIALTSCERESPDGRWVQSDCEIWVTNASGKRRVQLTDNRVHDGSPAWSPDGRRIAFVRGEALSHPGYVGTIYVMNADGTGKTALTTGVTAANPAWQPSPAT